MRRFGLIGDPVRHSLSPRMHRAAFQAMGIEAEYALVPVAAGAPERVAAAMRDLGESGGGNVTLPHKRVAAEAVEVASDDVRLTGACNCFWVDADGRLRGDNTDVGGLVSVLGRLRGFSPTGASVLLLGAGGAARAAVVALARTGIGEVRVRNRSPWHAAAMIEDLGVSLRERATVLSSGRDGRVVPVPALGLAEEPVRASEFDLVVQATRLGLDDADPLPLDLAEGAPAFALDLAYAPGETAWTHHARENGAEALDGLPVLLEQGVLSLERWLGRPVPGAARDAMWQALVSAPR